MKTVATLLPLVLALAASIAVLSATEQKPQPVLPYDPYNPMD